MGFLKRFFSIGSKKSKKRPQIVHNVDARLRAIEEEEHEAAIGRLLRSSSARYKVVSEIDYAALPPLPHPINEVIQVPSVSTTSLASSCTSQRGTYTVTVHGRRQDSLTKFPKVNKDLDHETAIPRHPSDPGIKESSQLLGLRSDPSVVSLLEMYDEHGRISSDAFSNTSSTPPKEGRPQARRNGSTLRQLLGNPSNPSSKYENESSTGEGDISWAERFLGENTSLISSSFDLRPPNALNDHFRHDSPPRNKDYNDAPSSTDRDLSINTYEHPTSSSMEVELSIADSFPSIDQSSKNRNPYASPNPTTPRRASQVFGFLTERRRSTFTLDPRGASPSELPSVFSVSDDGSLCTNEERSHFSSYGSHGPDHASSSPIPIPCFDDISASSLTDINLESSSSVPPVSGSDISHRVIQIPSGHAESFRPEDRNHLNSEHEVLREVKVIMTAPTRVIVTAPTPSNKLESPNRFPRGPRSQSTRPYSGRTKKQRSSLVKRSDSALSSLTDLYTPIPSRRRSRPSSLYSSSSSISGHINISRPMSLIDKSRQGRGENRSILTELNKENVQELSVHHKLPSTPLHSQSLFRAAVSTGTFKPPAGMTPSPASSADLSPVGRELMMNIRQQRSKAREADRERKGIRFGVGR